MGYSLCKLRNKSYMAAVYQRIFNVALKNGVKVGFPHSLEGFWLTIGCFVLFFLKIYQKSQINIRYAIFSYTWNNFSFLKSQNRFLLQYKFIHFDINHSDSIRNGSSVRVHWLLWQNCPMSHLLPFAQNKVLAYQHPLHELVLWPMN